MPPFDLTLYERLRTSTRVGAVVRHRERTGSTMDDARDGAEAGGADGTAYVAAEQTGGRGRKGRAWVSAASCGLYVTYHLCPPDAERAALLTLAGALAVVDAVSATARLATDLKWPNDVLCGGRKLAGVLAEARHGERIDVFLGIGINIRAPRDLLPEIARISTSIQRAGAPPPGREALLAALSATLEEWTDRVYEDPAGALAEWRSRLVTLGQHVRFATPTGEVRGEAIDVTERGELVLRLEDGSTASYAAGDVSPL